MRVNEIKQLSFLRVIVDGNDNEIEGVYIGDLLSFVMASGKEGCLWLTVQKSLNVIAVAQLNDFAAIIFVQDSYPDQDTIDKAKELNISLFVTDKDAYSLAKELTALGI
ncbi:MAG: hypothetical protein PHH04_02855 [Thomasclavelia sp.]|jgi:hypothetical protein|nr:hypothetical protein [Thomasclavelia sp.]